MSKPGPRDVPRGEQRVREAQTGRPRDERLIEQAEDAEVDAVLRAHSGEIDTNPNPR